MLSKIVLLVLLVCFVGLVLSSPNAIGVSCPRGLEFYRGRCFDPEVLKSLLEVMDK